MLRYLWITVVLACVTACASTGSVANGERLSLHVDGFVTAEGIT